MLTLCKPREERHLWEEQTPVVFDILLSKSPRCHLTSGHQSCKLIFLPWFLLQLKTDFFLLLNPLAWLQTLGCIFPLLSAMIELLFFENIHWVLLSLIQFVLGFKARRLLMVFHSKDKYKEEKKL